MTTLTTAREVSSEEHAWRSARNAEAAETLAQLPSRTRLLEACRDALAGSELTLPVTRGDRTFELRHLAGGEQLSLVVSVGGEPTTLLDADAESARLGAKLQVGSLDVSPDGEFAAVTVSLDGAEGLLLRVIRAADGSEVWPGGLTDGIMKTRWSGDAETLWLVRRGVTDGRMSMTVHRQPLTEATLAAAEPVAPSSFVTEIITSHDGARAVLQTGNTEAKAEFLFDRGTWGAFLAELPGSQQGVLVGEDYLAVVNGREPRGELVRIPLATATDATTWQTLVPAGGDVLLSLVLAGDRLVLARMRDAAIHLEVRALDGTLDHEIALPGEGAVGTHPNAICVVWLPPVTVDGDSVSFIHSTPTTPPVAYRYDLKTRVLQALSKSEIGARDFRVESLTAVGSDGVDIPVTLISLSSLPAGPRPLLLHAYGGFGLAITRGWQSEHTAWVEAGGVFAIAHVRGGGDLGRDWWLGGSQANGQRTADDVYTVAEFLVATGRTTHGQLGFEGMSNGGIVAATAIAQRPDLWAAVVSQVPLTDLTAAATDPLTRAILVPDYGDPDDPEVAARHAATSPVALVRANTRYPKTLVTAGENDPRCPSFHAANFTRLLRDADPSGEHLLRIYADQGHGSTSLEGSTNTAADWLAFLAENLGL